MSIPERTHIKADLKCVPKEQSLGGGVAAVAPPSAAAAAAAAVAIAEPSTTAAKAAPKRKMGMAQYLANKKRKEVEEVQSVSAAKDATSPVHTNGENKVRKCEWAGLGLVA